MVDIGIVIGLVVGWTLKKLQKVGKHADKVVDTAIEAGAERVDDLVRAKLSGNKALRTLDEEMTELGETSELTKQRLAAALAEAIKQDPEFAAQLPQQPVQTQTTVTGGAGVTAGRDVNANAVIGSANDVYFGHSPGPTRPGR